MSIQRETANDWVKGAKSEAEILKEQELELDVKKYRARFASILDRGIVAQRLALPPGIDPSKHYEFIPLDSMSQSDARLLGFTPTKVTAEPGSPESLHSTATGDYIVGDVMLMEIPKVYKQVIDEVTRERIEAKHGKPGQVNSEQREERQMKSDFQKTVGLPTIDEPSKASPVDLAHIRDAVQTND